MSKQPRTCPYTKAPATAFWRKVVADLPAGDVDPVLNPKFTISKTDKVATAGSCFAQHVARYLAKSGLLYFVTEPGHSMLDDETCAQFNYGTFSARYGNIYTTTQMVQTFDRAFGAYSPIEDHWRDGERFIDPHRPFIQPNGFSSLEELRCDRAFHLAAVRRMFEELDVFVFTLGLTEGWRSKEDGAVFPVCPGCGAGIYDPARYEFFNERFDTTLSNLQAIAERIWGVNKSARILLTVSPVPLIATMEPQHVLLATTYSKSVLRAAAGEFMASHHRVDYFPSYEIITGGYARGSYWESDLRGVREEGVQHVMRLLLRHYCDISLQTSPPPVKQSDPLRHDLSEGRSAQVANIICDEEHLDT